MNLIYLINPPCPKCPYTLGLVKTLRNPCPECQLNGYKTFERFQRQLSGLEYHDPKNDKE